MAPLMLNLRNVPNLFCRTEIVYPKSEIVLTKSDNQTPVHLADKTLKTSPLHVKSPGLSARIRALALSHKSVSLCPLISFLAQDSVHQPLRRSTVDRPATDPALIQRRSCSSCFCLSRHRRVVC
uniref:Uncharacterized protein n=1 Tax=Rousettus aegyptiacus TaxID=9407 RepID=A0A7J8B9R3_ROUAE|nr:hypothetical protein HJG63_009989 [Rousettus aegyptiacus]